MSTNTPSQSNKRAFGRTDGAADAMHFTSPNLSPLLLLIVMLPNFEASTVPKHVDDDKDTVFLAKNRFFDEEDETEVVSGGEEMALVAIAIFYTFFFVFCFSVLMYDVG